MSLVSSLNSAAPGVSVTLTATVTGGSPTGSVIFFDGATVLGSSALKGSFQATFSSTNLALGTHLITAQDGRSTVHAASTTQVVEYGSNLTGWTPILIPAATTGDVIITPGNLSDHVRVVMPTLGGQGFVRLKVEPELVRTVA